eukprot:232390-Pyramimonas_sp.AAC.1
MGHWASCQTYPDISEFEALEWLLHWGQLPEVHGRPCQDYVRVESLCCSQETTYSLIVWPSPFARQHTMAISGRGHPE